MKKKLLAGLAVGLFATASSTTIFATTLVTYEFTITGDQLMNYVITKGDDGSTAAENNIFDGARLYRGNDSRSYIASQNTSFDTWATTTTERLMDFNLWGYDGKGENWGEIYKVYDWVNTPTSSDANWHGHLVDWPWGSFDNYADGKTDYGDHYNNGELLGWGATSYTNGLGFDPGKATANFNFQMTLNMNDSAFNKCSPWYNGQEGQMVFWFGGSMMDSSNNWTDYYEGNIILQGEKVAPIPEPATMLLFGTGLAGLTGSRIRRKKKS